MPLGNLDSAKWAELSARLAHPNIVSVLDFGRVDDTYFLAVEHVAGVDLRS